MSKPPITEFTKERILVLDGAMGTMIQQHKFTEEDFRGEKFKNHTSPLKGNNDLLCLTQPEAIKNIHKAYFQAGSDIAETNTFNANQISQADYALEEIVYELNKKAAEIAVEAANEFTQKEPHKPRYVAGAMGPTNRTASLSPDVNDPGYRAVNFDHLVEIYCEQAEGLLDGGVDLLLVETVFDTLNAKAALFAIEQTFDKREKAIPVMVSGTITDASGRTLSGQTTEAFLVSISHSPLFSVGLNCALGAKDMRPYLQVLNKTAPFLVSAHPNAGLPNEFGAYDETPEYMAEQIDLFLQEGLLNIVGGCCGTTPEHIAAIAKVAAKYSPRKLDPTYS